MKHCFSRVDIFWIYFLGYDFGMFFCGGVENVWAKPPCQTYIRVYSLNVHFWYLGIKKQGISSASMSLLIL